MQTLKREEGFTLMEMLIVLGVLTIFITVLSNILLVSASISQKYDTNLSARSNTSIAFDHIETIVKKNDVFDVSIGSSIQVVTDPSTSKTMLKVMTDPGDLNGDILYYYFNPTSKKLYFYAGMNGGALVKDEAKSMLLIEEVQNVIFTIGGSNNNTLTITISTYIDKKATDINNRKNLVTTTQSIILNATS